MSATELLDRLREREVEVWAEGGKLRYRAPRDVMTPALRAELGRHKAEVLALLAKPERRRRPAPGRLPRPQEPPLSFVQARMWFFQKLLPENPLYNGGSVFLIEGPLDVDRLGRCLARVARRHEALRTTFGERDGVPFQVVAQRPSVPLVVVDETAVARRVDTMDGGAAGRLSHWVERPFDLARGPLIRVALVRRAPRVYLLAFAMHHIVSDAWSVGVLMAEVSALYTADEGPAALPALAVQYPDFAVWQRRWLSGEVLREELDYWRERLAGCPRVLELPADHTRPHSRSFAGRERPLAVAEELAGRFRRFARERSATLFMAGLALFRTLVFRYTGQPDLAVGTPVTARSHRDLEGLIGCFVNTLALRGDLTGNPTCGELVKRTREEVSRDYAHQEVPFEKLVDELVPRRDGAHAPLVQVLFALGVPTAAPPALPGLTTTPLPLPLRVAHFDLLFELRDSGSGFGGFIAYDTDLFDATTIDRLAGHYTSLMAGFADRPQARIGELAMLTPPERQQLMVDGNDTRAPYPAPASRNLLHLFAAATAERLPDAVALVAATAGGDTVLSYRELDRRSGRLARRLRDLGVGPEVRVGLASTRSPEAIVALLAVLEAGGAYVPLDPRYPAERLAFMAEDSGATVVLASRRELPAGLEKAFGTLRVVDLDDPALASPAIDGPAIDGPAVDGPAVHGPAVHGPAVHGPVVHGPAVHGLSPENLAVILYTSGSTGRPKGAALCHRGMVNIVHQTCRRFAVGEGSRVLQTASLSFDASVLETFMAFFTGGRLVRTDRELLFGGGAGLTGVLARQRVNVMFGVPTFVESLEEAELPELETLIVGGERCPPALAERWSRGRRLINIYGPTETSVYATCSRLRGGARTPPIGRPVVNGRIRLLGPGGRQVPAGVPGEVHIGGDGLARNYLGRCRRSAERFVPDPMSDAAGERLYRTGDLARHRADGELEFLDRLDYQIKLRGLRIELAEIESALGRCPEVAEAVVVAPENPPGHKRLVAFVVPRRDAEVSGRALAASIGEILPDYMVPSAFLTRYDLPKTATGKVDRGALEREAREAKAATETKGFVAPLPGTQQRLAAVWAEVLGVEEVGAHDNFFELGGDSILSIQLASRAAARGLAFTPRQVFAHQTVAELAAVTTLADDAVESEDGAAVSGEAPLTPIQRRFFELDLPEPHHFNQALMLRLDRALEPPLVEAALQCWPRRHDALRLRFTRHDGRWLQRVDPPGTELPLTRVDFGALAPGRRRQALEAAAALAQGSLELTRGPLARALCFDLAADEPRRLLLVAHHLAVDGVSWRVLLEELDTACRQLLAGGPVELPRCPASFLRWARGLSARTETSRREADYWKEVLDPEVATLPVEGGAGTGRQGSARQVEVGLDAGETRTLLREAHRPYRTRVEDLLVAAVARCLARRAGSERVRLDLEGHGRDEGLAGVDASRTVGWLTAIYPVLVEASPELGRGPTVKAVKERLRAVPRGGAGYGLLRFPESGEVSAALDRTSQLVFNYLGRLDRALPAGALFAPAEEDPGPMRGPRGERLYLLEVNARVAGERLLVSWDYSEEHHRRPQVEQLARDFLAELRALIAHCLSPEAGGATPSDFPLAGLDQQALDRLPEAGAAFEDLYPLTPLQEGILFHSLYEDAAEVYLVQSTFTLHGTFDETAFRRAWRWLSARHAVLRTGFLRDGLEEPLQAVYREAEPSWESRDWRDVPAAERQERLTALYDEDRRRGFDLRRPPLRFFLLRLAPEAWRFVFSYHHLVLDGWSSAVLLAELLAAYQNLAAGRPHDAAAPTPYRDYVAWIRGREQPAAQEYWRRTLADFSAATALPEDRAFPPDPDGEDAGQGVARARLRLPRRLTSALEERARSERCTLNLLVQVAWGLLLGRYADAGDVVFGATVSGRPPVIEGIETMVGLFINTVPVRLRATPGATVRAWLAHLQAEQAEQRDYELSSLVEIQALSQVPAPRPLFESLMVFESYPVDEALRRQPPGLEVRDYETVDYTTYPLTLAVTPGAELDLGAEYAERRFDGTTARRLLRHLGVLLEGFAARPGARLEELSALTAEERHQLVVEWRGAEDAGADGHRAHELVALQVARTPQSVAVVFEEVHLSYGELDRRANRLARHLRGLGVGPEVLVALCLERSPAMPVALLGVLKAGGAYLPLDPDHPAARTRSTLEDSGAPILLVDRSAAAEAVPREVTVVSLETEGGVIAGQAASDPRWPVPEAARAYVIYTSGSTGRPKGMEIPHRSLAPFLLVMARGLRLVPEDRVLQFAPLVFDVSVEEFFPAWVSGATVVMERREALISAARLPSVLARRKVTKTELPTTYWHEMVYEISHTGTRLPGCLDLVLISGERADVERMKAWRATGVPLVNTYGLTEVTVTSTLCRIPLGPEAAVRRELPIGRPLANNRFTIVDRRFRPVPAGVAGELLIGGENVGRGFLYRPALSAERFVPDPWGRRPGGRVYRSGDKARFRPDGDVEVLGRVDHQVKLRGQRLEPGEVEAVLARHPAVRLSVVLARNAPGGGRQLAAYVVADRRGEDLAEELKSYLGRTLPAYMVPAAFVFLDEMPRSSAGKVDRKALPEPRWESREAATGPGGAFRTPDEERMAAIWAGVLEVPRVGREESFFGLGGHSLVAGRLLARVGRAFDVELPLRDLFEAPTVAGLTRRVVAARRRRQGLRIPPIEARPRRGDPPWDAGPLSFSQQRLWFLEQLAPGTAFYNLHLSLAVEGPLRPDFLSASLDHVVRRHEVLRTTFAAEEGKPRQVVHAPAPVPLPVADLTALGHGAREKEGLRLLEEEARRPFDLARGPMMRVLLVYLGRRRAALALTQHHIVSDEWSVEVLFREVLAGYRALSEGVLPALAPLPVQYADFARWQRRLPLDGQLAYWREQLSGTPPLTGLATDRPRPAVQSFAGAHLTAVLPGHLAEEMETLGRSRGATLFMGFFTAFAALLHRASGARELVVGTAVANRQPPEVEGLIGFFVNMLALRVEPPADAGFDGLLARVRETALAAYDHQDVPFERLVDELELPRDLGYSPLYQVGFALRGTSLEHLGMPGLDFRALEVETGNSRLDMTVILDPAPQGLVVVFEYATDLFDRTTVARLAKQFRRLVEEVLADPRRPLAQVSLMSHGERHQVLAEWNDTRSAAPQADPLFHRVFEAHAERAPDAVAVATGAARTSYGELDARATGLARRLRDLGVGPEVPVAVFLGHSPELVTAFLGVLKAGGAYLPLDPVLPRERLAFMLADAAPSEGVGGERTAPSEGVGGESTASPVVVTRPEMRLRLPDGPARVVDVPEAAPPAGGNGPEAGVGPENLAYVIYTSGSTGRPKGVSLVHRNLSNLSRALRAAFALPPGCRVLQTCSVGFDVSVLELVAPLAAGGAVCPATAEERLPGPEMLALLADRMVTLGVILPPILAALPAAELPAFEDLIVGGDACTPELAARWAVGHRRVSNLYGPTEAAVWVTMARFKARGLRRDGRGDVFPIGRPTVNASIHLLDARAWPVPVGVHGELCIAGASVARGYLGRPGLAARCFVPDPFAPAPGGGRLYRTGDLARRLADGQIDFLGRVDHQVKVRGFRIELGEIEAAIRRHPEVRDAVVLVREDPPGHKRLVAWVVASLELGPTLRAALEEELPGYMVPSAFVTLDELPRTATDKVDRAALADRALPAPEAGRAQVPPRNLVEERLAAVWAEVLGLDEVGVDDNFFELGGDSILSIRVSARATAAGIRVTPRQVFEHQTVAELALHAGGGEGAGAEQAPVTGPVAFTPIQRWFFELEPEAPHHFNQALTFETREPVLPGPLAAAAAHLAVHHDALRLRFERGPEGWRQHDADLSAAPPTVTAVDLAALAPERRRPAIEAAAARLQEGFDLGEGPLLRLAFFDLGAAEPGRLTLVAHHLVVDGVSWGVLMEDLETAYRHLRAGERVSLPPKTTSFRRWAEGLAALGRSPELAAERAYWLEEAHGGQPRTAPLPVDRRGSLCGAVREVSIELDEPTTRALLTDVPAAWRARIDETLLSALVRVLAEWTGSSRVLLDLEGHGREEELVPASDLSRTVGWFTSLFPVWLEAPAGAVPEETLRSVREQLGRVPRRGIGYGLLRYLGDPETAGRLAALPAAEVSFNYLGRTRAGSARRLALSPARESVGPVRPPRGRRPHLLEVDGLIEAGRLRLAWSYSEDVHRRATIEELAGRFRDELVALIGRCRHREEKDFAAADFEEFGWGLEDLEEITAAIGEAIEEP